MTASGVPLRTPPTMLGYSAVLAVGAATIGASTMVSEVLSAFK